MNIKIIWAEEQNSILRDAVHTALAEKSRVLAVVTPQYPFEINAVCRSSGSSNYYVAWIEFDAYVTREQLETYGPILLNMCKVRYGCETGELRYEL